MRKINVGIDDGLNRMLKPIESFVLAHVGTCREIHVVEFEHASAIVLACGDCQPELVEALRQLAENGPLRPQRIL